MPRFQNPTFERVEIHDLLSVVSAYKNRGLQFVQLCATVVGQDCELLYAFNDLQAEQPGMLGLKVAVPDTSKVPSITAYYPAAFVFENETHDLFGIKIEGISIDFGGEFYTVSEKYPMNPEAAERERARSVEREDYDGEGADDE